jgi:hypothetical protein
LTAAAPARGGQDRLVAELRRQGGLIADAVSDAPPAGPAGPAGLAAGGPRAAGRREEYELLVDLIYEGYLLHYGRPRAIDTADADLALLAGDQLYALGLARLARLGDLDAVAELADVISLCAHGHAAGRPDLGDAAWEAGAVAVGWGASPEHAAAKEAARALRPGAEEALRGAARRASGNVAQER